MCSKAQLAISLMLLLAVSRAYAALDGEENPNDLPIINMDAVVVTATQTEEDAFTTAKSIDKVDEELLDIEQPESVAQGVKQLSNVNISQGPRQLSQQINVRGLSGAEVLQVLDNARQNFQNGHQGSYFIDPELLQEVEVLKGPGSSLWGSGAIGGVVNMRTVGPYDLLEEGQTLGAKVKGGTDSADDLLYTTDSIYGKAGDDNAYLLNYTYRNTHDITVGGGETIPNSAYRDESSLIKWVSDFTDHNRLQLSYIGFDAFQDVPSDPRHNEDGAENPLVNQNIFQQNWNATYDYDDPNNEWIDMISTLYFNNTEVTDNCLGECSETAGGPAREDFTGYQTFGLNGRNSSYFPLTTMTVGGEFYQDKTSGERNGEDRPQFPNARADVWASYIQFEIPFFTTWTLTPGIRYDHFRNDPEGNVDVNTGEILPVETESDVSESISLSWQTTKWLSLHAIYDEAFRAPAIAELYPSGTHFTVSPRVVNEFIPNPELQPEKAHNKEVSARLAFSDVLNKEDAFRFRVSAFRNHVNNLIQQQVLGPTETQYVNVPKALLKGIEVDTTYQLEDWFAGIAYGYVRGINEDPVSDEAEGLDQTDNLDDIPPERVVFNLGRYFYEDTMLGGLRLTHAWAQDKVSQPQNCAPDSHTPANACPIDAYTTLDFYAAWEPVLPYLDGLRIDFSINNMTDQKYYQSTSSLLPEEGLNVRIAAAYLF